MLRYHFSIFFDGDSCLDETGEMLLEDDAAIAHAKEVIQELKRHGANYDGDKMA
jgi:hypothetical protein